MAAPNLPALPLRDLVQGSRFASLDLLEQYYRGTVYDGRKFDWDGYYRGFGAAAAIEPGYYVPLKHRRPSARYDIGKVVVRRLTSFVLGESNAPNINVPGDEEAEDYVRELARVSNLWSKLKLARNLGGSCGTACVSWSIKRGRPRIRVHNPKHVCVLRWADEDDLRPAEVLKAYSYEERREQADGTVKTVTLWRVRVWTEEVERVYEPIPDEVQKEPGGLWRSWPSIEVRHGFGFCPFYWVQNQPEEEDYDGACDFDGACDLIDELNCVLSQTTKGTKANVDPTLVVREDPVKMAQVNQSRTVHKGSGNAIFAQGGAEYLQLSPASVDAGLKSASDLERRILDMCGVVKPDAEKLSGAAQSGKALEILYAPMLATCDTLREQYGDHCAVPILLDMLRVARKLATAEPTLNEQGELERPVFVLAPRIERVENHEDEDESEDGDDEEEGDELPIFVEVKRTPGKSESLELVWPPYFAPTWADRQSAVTAAQLANGGKPVISQRTSVAAVSGLFGVVDVDEELAAIRHDAHEAMEMAREAMGGDGSGGLLTEDEPEDDGADDEPAADDEA